jgi:hypothetical protein
MADGSDFVPVIDDATLASVLHNSLGPDAQPEGLWHGCPLHGGFGGRDCTDSPVRHEPVTEDGPGQLS